MPQPTPADSLQTFLAKTLAAWNARRLRFEIRATLKTQSVLNNTNLALSQRVRIAGQMLRDAVVVNLSRPVRKIRKTRVVRDPATGEEYRLTRTVVDPQSRSKRFEFPRADTTRLMKNVYHKHDAATATSRVGITLGYGVVLELKLDRSFLRRTLQEQRQRLMLIIQGAQI